MFPLFTSIKPPTNIGEISYFRDCFNSWHAAGFDPIALNGPSEIDMLRQLDLRIDFAPAATDGKPRIHAILATIRERGDRFAGIINSDCRIVPYAPDIAQNLCLGLDGRCVLAWRLDVEANGEMKPYPYGFDAFFFDTKVMPQDDGGFCIGETWWDLWFPYACEATGAEIETLQVPLLIHRLHSANWDQNNWLKNGYRFWTMMAKKGSPSEPELRAFSVSIPELLRAKAQTVSVMSSAVEVVARAGGRAMLHEVTRTIIDISLGSEAAAANVRDDRR